MEAAPALDPSILREVEASCLCLQVQRASRAVGRHYDNAFRPLGLNNWQFSLLTAIEGVGTPNVNELATLLGMDRTTMTRNLSVLQRRNLLTMRQDARDGRVRRASLTPLGRDLLLKALELWRITNEAVKATVPPASLPAVWQALGRIGQP